MSNDYDWHKNAVDSYYLAIKTLREKYLEQRLAGENAREWLERSSNEPCNMPEFCPKIK